MNEYVNKILRRKMGTMVEFGDGPSGWSRWTGQSCGSQEATWEPVVTSTV